MGSSEKARGGEAEGYIYAYTAEGTSARANIIPISIATLSVPLHSRRRHPPVADPSLRAIVYAPRKPPLFAPA